MDVVKRFKELGGKFYSKAPQTGKNKELDALIAEINEALPEFASLQTMTVNEKKKVARQLSKVKKIEDVTPRLKTKLETNERRNVINRIVDGARATGKYSERSLASLENHLNDTSEFPDVDSITSGYNIY